MRRIVEAVAGMTRTYTFAFDPDPEGGFVVTCLALPGLVTHGATLAEAREMARDAMEGYIEVLIEDGETVSENDLHAELSIVPLEDEHAEMMAYARSPEGMSKISESEAEIDAGKGNPR